MALALAAAPSGLLARQKFAPMPDRVLKAKTIFLDDQSGYPHVGDKAYQELEKWGRFKVVTNRKDADLILLISSRSYRGGYLATSNAQVYPTGTGGAYGSATAIGIPLVAIYGYLTFIDPATGEPVWSQVNRAKWSAGHTVHAMFKELEQRFAAQESTAGK